MNFFDFGKFVVDPSSNSQITISLLKENYESRDKIKKSIGKKLKHVRKLSMKNAILLGEFLKIHT
ncbi:MAG: hypothetical protein O2U61_05740 [Candidatus Bathyarchaeota archaeon]|nr:hypothetical protein [Candidatus Bathyarchaeota archaeon]